MFKAVLLPPSKDHIKKWNKISQDDQLRHLPNLAIIHTQPDIENDHREGVRVGEDFEEALAALSNFPNLDSVEIGFTPECKGEREDAWYIEVREEVPDRKAMLLQIFRAIQDRATDGKNRTIRKMTIVNLQNCPVPEFTSSGLFRTVMSQLSELHISMTKEYNEAGPDADYTRVELQTFPAHLCSEWLAPISQNLKALSLYSRTDNWGPFPGYFDPSGISFPKLETLALGYYTLAHDNDLSWVLTIKSLKKLILHKCMIVSWIRIDSNNIEEWEISTHDWSKMQNNEGDDWTEAFSYFGKWSQLLDRIASDLPNLRDFRFDYGSMHAYEDDDPLCGIGYRNDCGVTIFPKRYVCFDNGILPTPWPEADDDGEIYSWLDNGVPVNMHETTLEEDQKSLDKLLSTLRMRSAS